MFKTWLEAVESDEWLHGTASGDSIRKYGFEVSVSGFGQRSLRGIAVTKNKDDAWRYALAHFKSKDGPKPEILVCQVSVHNTIDLRHCKGSYDIWMKIGLDPMKDTEARQFIQKGNENKPFFLTDYLISLGYDSAFVDNTLKIGGPTELCIFSPNDIQIKSSDIHD